MAALSVNQFLDFIHHQVQLQEKVEACLWRLEALVAVAGLTDGFYDLSEVILHNYFSLVGDLIEEVTSTNRESLVELSKIGSPELSG